MYKYRKNQNYKFECKIPTCKQIEKRTDQTSSKSKQLTTEQTSDTKLFTKCRFIVEKQIDILKNKKALDNIRNSEAGHIMIDYRNCCAMINFDFKPCCSDGVNAGKIAKRILKKIEKKQNNLEFLLVKQCKIKFLLGSFQLRQAKSYMSDLAENPTAFIVKNDLIGKKSEKMYSKFKGTKIISIKLPSRHKRGKKKIINSQSENDIDSFKNSSKHRFAAVCLVGKLLVHVSSSSDSSCSSDESDENRSEIKKNKEIGQHVKNDQKTENSGSFVLLSINLKDFENHVPKWSAIIEYHDNILFHINNLNWDKAREVWINCIIEYKERPFERDMIYQLSLYGSEVEYFVKYKKMI
ncbi:hypothetical protein BpHYR1_039999 [Brachionus plicatilis]|uniref:Uncharacterized protein n=1 Tax=Brachionus plicatilis TaxID=10195 RepID=A0A3M7RG31_BRAPC|nr:hypothetical protein BpHYR1_039999 [Brachionus plicatilis]